MEKRRSRKSLPESQDEDDTEDAVEVEEDFTDGVALFSSGSEMAVGTAAGEYDFAGGKCNDHFWRNVYGTGREHISLVRVESLLLTLQRKLLWRLLETLICQGMIRAVLLV